jgi:predicted membrane protein
MSVLKSATPAGTLVSRIRGAVNELNSVPLAISAVIVWGAVGIELIHAVGYR